MKTFILISILSTAIFAQNPVKLEPLTIIKEQISEDQLDVKNRQAKEVAIIQSGEEGHYNYRLIMYCNDGKQLRKHESYLMDYTQVTDADYTWLNQNTVEFHLTIEGETKIYRIIGKGEATSLEILTEED